MANTVIAIRSSGVASNVPSVGSLANGEIALNFADGVLYYKTSTGTLGNIRTAQPAGLTTEVQFNDAGSFGGDSGFTFNKTTKALTVTGNLTAANVNSQSFIQFGDGTRQFTANAGGAAAVTSVAGATGAVSNTQILTGLLTVDGANSGLDADLLDGLQGASYANAAFAQASFNQANTANVTAEAGFGRANSANILAQAAFNQANTANVTAQAAFSRANTANITADAAFSRANTANITADAAFSRANTTNVTADAAFSRANSANVLAQAAFDKANSVTQQGFVTITANGTNVVADANNDTLTLTAANGVGIFANATTDAITINLTPTGVTSGTYANATHVPVIAVDTFGRVTSLSNTIIQSATVSQNGIVRLNDTITSTSTTQAGTANSVNTAYVTAVADALAFAVALG